MTLLERTPQQLRDTAIVTAAWTELGRDATLADADLHVLVSRRPNTVERMLRYVGRAGGRTWGTTVGNEWKGDWRRTFEYPRLPAAPLFDARCNIGPTAGACDPARPLKDWSRTASGNFTHDYAAASGVRALWTTAPVGATCAAYQRWFRRDPGDDPVAAVRGLFAGSERYDERNLLNCDHAIQCLNLEALLECRSETVGNTTWFSTLIAAKPAGWRRINSPWTLTRFLGSDGAPTFFTVQKVSTSDLAVGDHVIVYNHPAYDRGQGELRRLAAWAP